MFQPDTLDKAVEDAEEAVEEIGQEVLEGGDVEEKQDGEVKKENFSKNPSHSNNNNNNNNVKKEFNKQSAKRKVSIPLHLVSMEQENVSIFSIDLERCSWYHSSIG